MMQDPREIEALTHLVRLSASVEAQLSVVDRTPLKAVLVRAQDEAAAAMVSLTTIDPHRPDVIRDLQGKVWRYEYLVRSFREMIAEGFDAEREITQAKSEEFRGLIVDMTDDERTALGLAEPGAGSE